MTLTFSLARSDYQLFQTQAVKLLRKRLPRSWGFLIQMFVWIFIGIAVSLFMRLYGEALGYRRQLAITGFFFILAFVAFIAGQWISARMVRKHLVLDDGFLLSQQTIELDINGIASETCRGLGSSRFAWQAFIGRTEDSRNFYLHLEPTQAVIIPKSIATGPAVMVIRENLAEL